MGSTSRKLFVLARDKRPLANCNRCQIPHDPEDCQCLTCHGFYAATDDDAKLRIMNIMNPDHPWAVRTGKASGIVVIDVDGAEGLESLNMWESLTGFPLVESSTIAQTPSGGLHLFYQYPNVDRITSRSRVLPGIDIKADDAYVVIPTNHDPARTWKVVNGMAVIDSQLLYWLQTAQGYSAGGSSLTYSINEFIQNGCPDGYRDDFFNKLAFGYRKANVSFEAAKDLVYSHWLKCAQPIEFQTSQSCGEARWYMPWKDALYKLTRVYKTVAPDPSPVTAKQCAYLRHLKHLGLSLDQFGLTTACVWGDTGCLTHPAKAAINFKKR